MTLACFHAVAVAGEKYPAAYFTPEITYQDPALIEELAGGNKTSEPAVADKFVDTAEPTEKYPAAYFTPKIIFQDESVK